MAGFLAWNSALLVTFVFVIALKLQKQFYNPLSFQ